MADVGLHRTDGTKTDVSGVSAESTAERLDLQRIPNGGTGSMALHKADGLGWHAG